MKNKTTVVAAFLLGGTVGLAAHPVMAQEAPGETRQPDRQLTRPGNNENIPGMQQGGTQELSRSDMEVVQQALEDKGYGPGRKDGIADDNTRQAIRDFQRDGELPMTGVIDQRTAENLGLAWQGGADDGKYSSSVTHSPFS
jgi:peptidoglycan hydrolase-like protein with peptidoglycan-binding domain